MTDAYRLPLSPSSVWGQVLDRNWCLPTSCVSQSFEACRFPSHHGDPVNTAGDDDCGSGSRSCGRSWLGSVRCGRDGKPTRHWCRTRSPRFHFSAIDEERVVSSVVVGQLRLGRNVDSHPQEPRLRGGVGLFRQEADINIGRRWESGVGVADWMCWSLDKTLHVTGHGPRCRSHRHEWCRRR